MGWGVAMNENCFEFEFSSEMAIVRNVVHNALDFIDENQKSLTLEQRSDLKLVLSELLYNAVIHGNRKDTQKYVYIRIEIADSHVLASIQDEGHGFDHRAVIRQARSENALLRENGRGMILVCALTDAVYFNETGNQIRFVKALKTD